MDRIYHIFSFNELKPLIFTQLDFWLFFIFVMLVFSFLHKKLLTRSIFLSVVSIFFYYKTSGIYVTLLIVSLFANYFLGNGIEKAKTNSSRNIQLTSAILFNLLTLGYFKYAYFFTESFNNMFHTKFEVVNQLSVWANGFAGDGTFVEKIILPVGVSFFTFQSISYVMDIYRKDIEPVKNFFEYSFFVTFFPQLVAGPIVRAKDFIPQIRKPFTLSNEQFSWALILITKGLFKKIILADYIAVHFIDKIADAPQAYPGFVSILAMWAYSLQIYADFSGYTDIAIGLSCLMGFALLPNFNSPYKAISVADFWRRWHKSLGSWFRDYLYIPLGGNKTGGLATYIASLIIFIFLLFITQWYELIYVYGGLMTLYFIVWFYFPFYKNFIHRDLNLLITMVVGGLWHGASENFVIWGTMNGIALIFYNYWKKISPYENSTALIVRFWRIFVTFQFITFTRIWFRLEDSSEPLAMINHIWNHLDLKWDIVKLVFQTYSSVFWIITLGYFLHWMPQSWKDKGQDYFTKMNLGLKSIIIVICVFLMYQAISDTFKPFVYFQF
jgi:D-alanyl-lipoteichoic acid acyltransferase DltB (MBOAT superfamily)